MGIGEATARDRSRLQAGLSATAEGTVEDYDWPNRLVLVNVGGAATWMRWAGTAPWRGDLVRVISAGQIPTCMSVYGSAMGTYVSVDSNIATVTGDDGQTYTYPVQAGATFTGGDRVALLHSHQLVVGEYATEPLDSEYFVPGAPPGGGGGLYEFRPTASGSYRDGVYRGPLVEVNEFRTGMYWYGTQIADSIPDSAVITKATITLAQTYDEIGVASLLGTHTQASPAGEPSITGVVAINSGGVFDITAIADALKTGAGYGVGFQIDTGYRAFESFATSGTIHIEAS